MKYLKLFEEEHYGCFGEVVFNYFGSQYMVDVEDDKVVDVHTGYDGHNNLSFRKVEWESKEGWNEREVFHCKPEYWHIVLDDLLNNENSRLVILEGEEEEIWEDFEEVIRRELKLLKATSKYNL